MNTQSLRIATAMLLGLMATSMATAAESNPVPMIVAVEVESPSGKTTATLSTPSPVAAPATTECTTCGTCSTCSTGKSKGSCCARLLEWLTYQPLCKPMKCCKPSAYPCCQPRLYWFFPCVDCYGQCPIGGYAAKTCGCQH
jgi:hypothetical protein